MKEELLRSAGYNTTNHSAREVLKRPWDDNYELIPVGSPYQKGMEYTAGGIFWEACTCHKDKGQVTTDYVHRRLKPGLEKIRVVEV